MSSGVSACGFAAAGVFAGHAEMARWLCLSPRRCRVRASGWPGSRTGRSPAGVAGAGGVLDAGGPRADDQGLRGKAAPQRGLTCMRLSSPHGRSSGRAARWLHSSLRLSPARLAGGHGAGSRQGPGGANQTGARAAGPGGACRWPWRGAECSAASRPVAGGRIAGGRAPGRRAVMRPGEAAVRPGGGRARRACRSRPG